MTKEISTYEKISKINEENLEMARQKLPVNLKKLRGTYRKSRELVNEHLTSGIPKKPSNLTPGASTFWDVVINRLSLIGSIDVCDDIAISILCESLAEYYAMTDYLNEHGYVYTFENSRGEVVNRTRPQVKIQNDAWVRIFQLFKEYGLTHKSRNNITPNPLEQTPNKWTNLRRFNEK